MRSLVSPRAGVVEMKTIRKRPALNAHRVLFSVVSPGTERAFICGAAASAAWPYRPGYSACTRQKDGRIWAVRCPHASHWEPFIAEWGVPVPSGVKPQDAAFTTIGQVAIQAVRRAEPYDGEPVTVVGGGLIGMMIAAVAHAQGHPARLIHALSPATWRQSSDPQNRVIEASGTAQGFSLALRLVARRGTLVIAGSHRRDYPFSPYDFHKKQARMIGAWANGDSDQEKQSDEALFLRLVAAKRIFPMALANHRTVPWRKALPAYRAMLRHEGPKGALVIDWRGA